MNGVYYQLLKAVGILSKIGFAFVFAKVLATHTYLSWIGYVLLLAILNFLSDEAAIEARYLRR